MEEAILDIKNLKLAHPSGGQALLKDVSLSVRSGEVVGLVGESGSGKTLTSLAIMGLLSPALRSGLSGSITLRGDELIGMNDAEMRAIRGGRIAMIFQEPMSALNPLMRCGSQIAEGIALHGRLGSKAARTEALLWMKRVRLPDPERMFNSYPHQLSGGQRQRVMIAMALGMNPQLLIADEPTTALDVTVQADILSLLTELQRDSGFGILFITHDLAVVRAFAHRAAVMHNGSVVESGTSEEICLRPTHPYTRSLLACLPLPKERLPLPEAKIETSGSAGPTTQADLAQYRLDTISQVTDLCVTYKSTGLLQAQTTVHALRGVSLNIYRGETLGIVGESGSGKTTLGRTLLGLIHPTSGSVSVNGRSIMGLSSAQKRALSGEIQLVFQDPFASLNPRMRIGDAIAEAVRGPGKRSRAAALLDLTGLGAQTGDRWPHELSGGQRQRVVIARALAPGPSLLVCDESVAALDVSVRARILDLLSKLKSELGLTLIFITHDLGVVRQMADRVAVLRNGKLIECAETELLFRNPANEYTSTLLAAMPSW